MTSGRPLTDADCKAYRRRFRFWLDEVGGTFMTPDDRRAELERLRARAVTK